MSEQQRARAEDLADRDEFRTALVNSLQEGFFVADGTGAVIEINDAFADITGYGFDGLPYTWQHPWMADDIGSGERLARLLAEGTLTAEAPLRHRDGRIVWVAISVNAASARAISQSDLVSGVSDIFAPENRPQNLAHGVAFWPLPPRQPRFTRFRRHNRYGRQTPAAACLRHRAFDRRKAAS